MAGYGHASSVMAGTLRRVCSACGATFFVTEPKDHDRRVLCNRCLVAARGAPARVPPEVDPLAPEFAEVAAVLAEPGLTAHDLAVFRARLTDLARDTRAIVARRRAEPAPSLAALEYERIPSGLV